MHYTSLRWVSTTNLHNIKQYFSDADKTQSHVQEVMSHTPGISSSFVKSWQYANLLIKVHRPAFARFVSNASMQLLSTESALQLHSFVWYLWERSIILRARFVWASARSSPRWCATVSLLFYIQYHSVLFLISYSTENISVSFSTHRH